MLTWVRTVIESYVTGRLAQISSLFRSQMDLFYQLHMTDKNTELVKDNSQNKSETLTE
jgi:hypothetical protein